jgi:hypothetical protein
LAHQADDKTYKAVGKVWKDEEQKVNIKGQLPCMFACQYATKDNGHNQTADKIGVG